MNAISSELNKRNKMTNFYFGILCILFTPLGLQPRPHPTEMEKRRLALTF